MGRIVVLAAFCLALSGVAFAQQHTEDFEDVLAQGFDYPNGGAQYWVISQDWTGDHIYEYRRTENVADNVLYGPESLYFSLDLNFAVIDRAELSQTTFGFRSDPTGTDAVALRIEGDLSGWRLLYGMAGMAPWQTIPLPALADDAWHHLRLEVLDNTTVSFQLRLEGDSTVLFEDQLNQALPPAKGRFLFENANINIIYDDIIIEDLTPPDTPTPTPSPSPTISPTPAPTATPTNTPILTPTPLCAPVQFVGLPCNQLISACDEFQFTMTEAVPEGVDIRTLQVTISGSSVPFFAQYTDPPVNQTVRITVDPSQSPMSANSVMEVAYTSRCNTIQQSCKLRFGNPLPASILAGYGTMDLTVNGGTLSLVGLIAPGSECDWGDSGTIYLDEVDSGLDLAVAPDGSFQFTAPLGGGLPVTELLLGLDIQASQGFPSSVRWPYLTVGN